MLNLLNLKTIIVVVVCLVIAVIANKLYIDNLQTALDKANANLVVANQYIENNNKQMEKYLADTQVLLTEIKQIKEHFSEQEVKISEALQKHKEWSDSSIPDDISSLLYKTRTNNNK